MEGVDFRLICFGKSHPTEVPAKLLARQSIEHQDPDGTWRYSLIDDQVLYAICQCDALTRTGNGQDPGMHSDWMLDNLQLFISQPYFCHKSHLLSWWSLHISDKSIR
jgi:hypothetical protein